MYKKYDLKPCPFCGGEATFSELGAEHFIYCKNCCATMTGIRLSSNWKRDAVERWNRRVNDE